MRSKRFEPIRELVANAATDLSRAVGEAARRVADAERQLETLSRFRDEYVRKAAQPNGAMDAVRLQNFRSFLDRLDTARRGQIQAVGAARADYEARRTVWSAKRVEAESLGRAVERFRLEENKVAEQREQRDGDEAALRQLLVFQALESG